MITIHNSADKQTELANCNFVKTSLMIFIVLGHSVAFYSGNWFTCLKPVGIISGLTLMFSWLGSFHTYAFVLISGYIFYYVKYERNGYQQLIPFVSNKARRLIIPYLFLSLMWVIPLGNYFFHYDLKTIVANYVLGISPDQLWFLLMLFLVFVMAYCLSNTFKEKGLLGFIIITFLYFGSFVGAALLPNFFQIWNACRYLTLFWIGFQMRYKSNFMFNKVPLYFYFIVDIVLFVAFIYVSRFDSIIVIIFRIVIEYFLHIVGALIAFLALQRVANLIKWRDSKLFEFVSQRSMTIYLFHQQMIYFLIYWLNGIVNPYLNAIINFIGAMVMSLIISGILHKFKITRFLVGEKTNN